MQTYFQVGAVAPSLQEAFSAHCKSRKYCRSLFPSSGVSSKIRLRVQSGPSSGVRLFSCMNKARVASAGFVFKYGGDVPTPCNGHRRHFQLPVQPGRAWVLPHAALDVVCLPL